MADTLAGGTDDDRLSGGSGPDVFLLRRNCGADRVLDFNPDMDRIDAPDGARLAAEAGGVRVTLGNASLLLVGLSGAGIPDISII